MDGSVKIIAMVMIGCGSVAAFSQQPIEAENLLFSSPKDFKVGRQSNRDNRMMTEFVPITETVEDWTQMLTVQIYRGATIGAAAFLEGIGKRFMDACPGTTW